MLLQQEPSKKSNLYLQVWPVPFKLLLEPVAHSLEGLLSGAAASCFAGFAGVLGDELGHLQALTIALNVDGFVIGKTWTPVLTVRRRTTANCACDRTVQ